ncbi:MAG: Tn3 family transposase [Pseudomonadota bacterium]
MLEALDLGREGVRYYAGGVLRSEMFQLHRRAETDRHLHAIAFIADQHHRLHDALIDRLLSVVQSFDTAAARDHKDQVFERRQMESARVETLLDTLEMEVFGALRDIRSLIDDARMSPIEKLERIRIVLDEDRDIAFQTLRADIRRDAAERDPYFQALEHRSRRLQNRISPILRVVRFASGDRCPDLMAAIVDFREKDGAVTPNAPMAFLDPDERDAVLPKGGAFRVSLYKVFLFRHVAGAIKAGNLNLEGSYKYRPLDDYLISRDRWEADKAQFLKRAGLKDFVDPTPVLAKLDAALHRQYQQTNDAIRDGANPHLTITAKGGFRVATPAQEEFDSEPLQRTLSQRHFVPLPEILATINRHCGLLDEFRHWQQAYVHQAPNPATLFAGIMGLGCGIGAQRMARISPSVTERELEHAINWRFSLDNIVAANDRVVAAMDRMELPAIYRRSQETLHTSSDGQKFEVRRESLNASYSFKYFGKGQGVSAYTFIDERNILWHSLVFSAAERESAYVIDGLMHNDVIRSNIHSTDEHGYNETMFGVTHLLGLSYAPRIKNIAKQQLYRLRSCRKDGADWRITPAKYVNEAAIRENWDDLLRLVATIKLKEAAASDIFRRLNSYSRQHRLYKAMKAFGQIVKSLFILRYLDDLELRQAIEKQLNKVELANRFTRAVAVGNPREFAQVEKEEQEIAEACNRLIKNCIICWNYLYLARQIERSATPEERDQLLRTIATHSPIAWAHINMLGEYDFSEEKLQDTSGVLPPKNPPEIIPPDWALPNRQKPL